jgi:hypothetical protein
MTTLATAHVSSTAAPGAFFDRWADMATWPEWNLDTEWVQLDGPFVTGSTGTLKPKGGPKVPFVIERLIDGREFVDVSKLIGARLTFAHLVTEHPAGGCDVDVSVSMTGPLGWLWKAILGKGLVAGVQPDLERLVAVAEQTDRAAETA